jgi:hypothetical protein
MTGSDAINHLEALGFTVTMARGKLKVGGRGDPPAELRAALAVDRAGAIEYLRRRERHEDTLGAFSRLFGLGGAGHRDVGEFLRDTGRRKPRADDSDDYGGDGRIA